MTMMTKAELEKALQDERAAHAQTRQRHTEEVAQLKADYREQKKKYDWLRRILSAVHTLIEHELASPLSLLVPWAIAGGGALLAYLAAKSVC